MTPPIRSIVTACPSCHLVHVDEGEWRYRPHRKHLCAACGHVWAPAQDHTRGVSVAEWVELVRARRRLRAEQIAAEQRLVPPEELARYRDAWVAEYGDWRSREPVRLPIPGPGVGRVRARRGDPWQVVAFKCMLMAICVVDLFAIAVGVAHLAELL